MSPYLKRRFSCDRNQNRNCVANVLIGWPLYFPMGMVGCAGVCNSTCLSPSDRLELLYIPHADARDACLFHGGQFTGLLDCQDGARIRAPLPSLLLSPYILRMRTYAPLGVRFVSFVRSLSFSKVSGCRPISRVPVRVLLH